MALVFGVLVGLISNALAIGVGRWLGLLDRPHGIKIHASPVPFTGGLGYVLVLTMWMLVAPLPLPFFVAAISIWAVGLADDIRPFRPVRKLSLQSLALLLAVPALDGQVPLRLVAVAIGLVLINTFNLIDGLDGLAGGVAFFALLPTALASSGAGLLGLTTGFAGAFLVLNLPPAKIFLGNQGSLVLGYALWFVSTSWVLSDSGPSLLGAALVWSVPLANAIFVVARRVVEHRPLFTGDRSHLYDELHRRIGLRATVVTAWAAAAAASVVGSAVL